MSIFGKTQLHMEGVDYLFLLPGLLLFISILFTGLLILHFMKIRPSVGTVVTLVLATIVASVFLINTEWLYSIGFSYLLFYSAAALLGYMLIVGFTEEKTLPSEKGKS